MTAAVPSIHYYCSSHSRMHQQPAAVPVRGLNSSQFKSKSTSEKQQRPPLTRESDGGVPSSVTGRDIKQGLSSIQVPRQKYIPVSKSDLLNAIVLKFEWQEEEIDQFLLVSSCLDSILHAEHRSILEEMRMDYDLTHSLKKKGNSEECLSDPETQFVSRGKESDSATDNAASDTDKNGDKTETDELKPSYFSPDLIYLFGFSPKRMKSNLDKTSVAVASRFQRAFVQLLYNAQFEELSARDLMLTSALNTDYLLTLPIYVDWKKASESNAIIFRRGYATEKQKGLLIVEKLDYLQSRLLQGIFHVLSKPLEKVGIWLAEALGSIIHGEDAQVWINKLKPWIKDVLLFQKAYSYEEDIADESLGADNGKDNDLPIWLAAQKAVTRYEGILSSIGPRGRLLRKLLTWVGLVPPTRENPFDSNSDILASETYLRPIFLPRISLNDIWEPATRKYSGNNLWKMLKNIVSILLSQSLLQEPSFEELILLYTKESEERETNNKTEVPSLQLKIYERIPIPDLPVIFPHKKLSFRILDTVRLDVATILGLLAYFINYKFENILSSPSAILLDVIAVTALIIYVTRVALGYKQTWERYQLLVNRTLYEKTIASGFGSVHFLLDASEQQQYKEAILAYAVLLKAMNGQMTCGRTIGDKCERFLYDVFNEKVEMPVDKAIDTLIRLDLVKKKAVNGDAGLQAIPCLEAYEILKERWNRLLRKSD